MSSDDVDVLEDVVDSLEEVNWHAVEMISPYEAAAWSARIEEAIDATAEAREHPDSCPRCEEEVTSHTIDGSVASLSCGCKIPADLAIREFHDNGEPAVVDDTPRTLGEGP